LYDVNVLSAQRVNRGAPLDARTRGRAGRLGVESEREGWLSPGHRAAFAPRAVFGEVAQMVTVPGATGQVAGAGPL